LLGTHEKKGNPGVFALKLKGGQGSFYAKRSYRRRVPRFPDWHCFQIRYRESDLWIQADMELLEEAERLLIEGRLQVEGYGEKRPEFLFSHTPIPLDDLSPHVPRKMMVAGIEAEVGPMAAVAGAIAEYVGEGLMEAGCKEVVVENGGDIYVAAKRPIIVGVFAGDSPLSGRIGISLEPGEMPLGVATSSATVGHSWSYGTADAACIVAKDPAFADAMATALGNRVRGGDLEDALKWAVDEKGAMGALVIVGSKLAVKGKIRLTAL
jgi:ApbE superfamily uncharacterized protein (UPF0280 family)